MKIPQCFLLLFIIPNITAYGYSISPDNIASINCLGLPSPNWGEGGKMTIEYPEVVSPRPYMVDAVSVNKEGWQVGDDSFRIGKVGETDKTFLIGEADSNTRWPKLLVISKIDGSARLCSYTKGRMFSETSCEYYRDRMGTLNCRIKFK